MCLNSCDCSRQATFCKPSLPSCRCTHTRLCSRSVLTKAGFFGFDEQSLHTSKSLQIPSPTFTTYAPILDHNEHCRIESAHQPTHTSRQDEQPGQAMGESQIDLSLIFVFAFVSCLHCGNYLYCMPFISYVTRVVAMVVLITAVPLRPLCQSTTAVHAQPSPAQPNKQKNETPSKNYDSSVLRVLPQFSPVITQQGFCAITSTADHPGSGWPWTGPWSCQSAGTLRVTSPPR